MSIFKNIGHIVASLLLGAARSLLGQPSGNSVAEQVGSAAVSLIGIADPQAKAIINAAVTGYGDIVQAVKAVGGELKAGSTLNVVVSAALADASKVIWPDVEKVISSFEAAFGKAPAAAPAN